MVATFPRLADAGRKGSSAMEAETCLKSRDRLKVPSTGRVFFFSATRETLNTGRSCFRPSCLKRNEKVDYVIKKHERTSQHQTDYRILSREGNEEKHRQERKKRKSSESRTKAQ